MTTNRWAGPQRSGRLGAGLLATSLLCLPADGADQVPSGATSCLECHDGHGPGMLPALDDFPAKEIAASLEAYRTGRRAGTIMPRIAGGFSSGEARAIAEALGKREP